MAKPKQNTKKIVVYVTPELLEHYKQEVENRGLNVSNLIRMISNNHTVCLWIYRTLTTVTEIFLPEKE